LVGIETRFLRLILKVLVAGFHRNTSKSQTFSILNCYFFQISVTIEKSIEDKKTEQIQTYMLFE